MALSYTQTQLHTALQVWNVNADPDFVTTLPEIVKKGEILLARTLDLDNLDTTDTSVTLATGVQTATKPTTLINEREVTVTVAGAEYPVVKRTHGWVQLYAAGVANGTPKYYCERSETLWAFTPTPAGSYPLTIRGNYTFASIEDGAGSGTTWFSTRVPDLLYYACAIEACEFLKAWSKKAQNEADFAIRVKEFVGIAKNLQRSDIEDIVGNRMNQNQPGTQG